MVDNGAVDSIFNLMVEYRPSKSAQEEALSAAFHALSDPSRRKIIELLREVGEQRVGELAEAFSMSLNGVSKHLKVLEHAGMVTRRVEGRSHFIAVNGPSLQAPYEWLHFHHHFWATRLDALAELIAPLDDAKKRTTKRRKEET